MQCRSCGNILQAETETCPVCGASPSSAFSEFSSYEDDGNSGSLHYIPYTQTQPGSNQQLPPEPQVNALPPSYTQPQFYSDAQHLSGVGFRAFPEPAQELAAAPARRGGLSAPVVVLLVVLALCLGVGGTFAYIGVTRHAQNQTSGGTQTNRVTGTSNLAQQTKTLDTSNVQLLYTQATGGTPVFSVDSNTSWTTMNDSDRCVFTGSVLQLTSSAQTAGCLANSTSFDNFALQANVILVQADYAALAFSISPINQTGYAFGISSKGVYVIVSGSPDSQTGNNSKLLTGGTSSAINTGPNPQNLLTAIVFGSSIYFYINQQYVTTVSVTTPGGGLIGVIGGNQSSGSLDVTFGNIRIWQL